MEGAVGIHRYRRLEEVHKEGTIIACPLGVPWTGHKDEDSVNLKWYER